MKQSKIWKNILYFLLWIFCIFPIVSENFKNEIVIFQYMETYEDKEKSQSFEAILQNQFLFKKNQKTNYGGMT